MNVLLFILLHNALIFNNSKMHIIKLQQYKEFCCKKCFNEKKLAYVKNVEINYMYYIQNLQNLELADSDIYCFKALKNLLSLTN